ncbi:hypothetical protein V1478_008952 [Vespula squamosa]|uniref:Uncharacterized protein n=1 Tax=Vespula squamosa TaxID=30214 RepID=A0ABD2AUY5_VESSQ
MVRRTRGGWQLAKFRARRPRNSFRYENNVAGAVAVDVAAAVAVAVAVAAVASFTKGIPSATFSGFRNILAALSSN